MIRRTVLITLTVLATLLAALAVFAGVLFGGTWLYTELTAPDVTELERAAEAREDAAMRACLRESGHPEDCYWGALSLSRSHSPTLRGRLCAGLGSFYAVVPMR